MSMENITDYIKEAFAYKNSGEYKKAIDYFYKALAIDNESSEILLELANLYTLLFQYDRAIGLYEQILEKDSLNDEAKYSYALLLNKIKQTDKAEKLFLELCNEKYELLSSAKFLFEIYSNKAEWKKIIDLFNQNQNSLKNSEMFYLVGNAYKNEGNTVQANVFFKKSFELDNKNINAGIEVINIYLEDGKTEEAENLAKELLKTSENDKLFCALGDIAYSKSDLNTAINNYSFAIKLNDKNASYYFKLGLVYSVKGFYQEAEESYCYAIDLDSENEIYNYGLAFLYYSAKKYDLALRVLDLILNKDKENAQAITLKSIILMIQNAIAEAGELIAKLDSNIKDDFALFAQALYYSKIFMYDKAISTIEKAIKINPYSLDYKIELASYNYKLSQFETAYDICEEIIKGNDKYLAAYILQIKILYKQKKFDKIQEKVIKIKSLDRNNPDMYYILGEISYNNEDFDKALENFKIAVSIQPQNDKYYIMVGNCYYKLGLYEDAYYYFKEASEINLANANNYYMMAKCAESTGNNETALSHFSVMKRLAPQNIEYIKDYALFLNSYKGKKAAAVVIKSAMKTIDKTEKEELKDFLKKIK